MCVIRASPGGLYFQMSNSVRTLVKKKLFKGALLFGLTIAPGFATALFQGNFATDDQVALFNITANASETLTIETYSYAGGTVNSTLIPSGGFAPTAFLFDDIGDVLTLTNG